MTGLYSNALPPLSPAGSRSDMEDSPEYTPLDTSAGRYCGDMGLATAIVEQVARTRVRKEAVQEYDGEQTSLEN